MPYSYSSGVDPPRGLSYGAGNYADLIARFLGDLPQDYEEGRANQFRELQRQRALQLQRPINTTDPREVLAELQRRGGAEYADPRLLQELQPAPVSPMFRGGGTPQGAPLASTAAARPTAPATGGGDQPGAIVDIVSSRLSNSQDAGMVIGNIASTLRVDPNTSLSPSQTARASRLADNYAKRLPAPPASFADRFDPTASATVPARSSAPSAAAGEPLANIILPQGFTDPRQAILALRREAGRLEASPNKGEQRQAPEVSSWADRIEKLIQPIGMRPGEMLVDPASGRRLAQAPGARAGSPEVVSSIADAIAAGHQPPSLIGLYGMSGPVRAELEQRGFDLAAAQVEWQRAQRQVTSLNAPQMTRFVGLASSVDRTIDEVRELSQQMELGGVPLINRAQILRYSQTQGNSPNGQLAARYIGALNTLKEEFANLAQGGYAPTESVWALANRQINEDYGVKQLGASLDEVQRLIRYRVQAVPGLSTLGPGAPNRYVPGGGGAPAAPASGAAPSNKEIPPPPAGFQVVQ